MSSTDYVTKAELQAILERYSLDAATSTADALRSLAEQLVALFPTRDEAAAYAFAGTASSAALVADEVARVVATDAVRAHVERIAASIVVNVPEAQPPTVVNVVELPARTTTTKVERDKRSGLITKTTATETDA